MEFLDSIIALFSLQNLLAIVLGVLVGFVIGALPGFDITTGVALLLPLTYVMAPDQGLIFFSAVYCAGVFGGSITAILFNIPGTSESVMTAVEGYPFTRRGEPGLALGMSIISSGLSGIAASVVLIFLAPLMASVALKFGPSEYAALGVLGLACVSAAAGRRVFVGVAAALLGLLLGTVGMDRITATPRFVIFDGLAGGIDFVAAIVGLFAIAEIIQRIAIGDTVKNLQTAPRLTKLGYPSIATYFRLRVTIARSWLVGLLIGIVPGAGAATAAFVAHGLAARLSSRRSNFGKGELEGVAAPEAANNAASVGAMIPLLSLGIPGSGTTAVMLGAFAIHNLQPGPLLFIQQPELVDKILWAILLANVAFVGLAFIFVRVLALMVRIRFDILATAVLTVSVGSALAIGGLNVLAVMLGFAALGMILNALSVPIVPVILGLILGPIIETSFRRALLMSGDEILPILMRPLTAGLLGVAVILLIAPTVLGAIAHFRTRRDPVGGTGT